MAVVPPQSSQPSWLWLIVAHLSRSSKQVTYHANTLARTYSILNLFFTAGRNRKIRTAFRSTCGSTKLTPLGIFKGELTSA